MEESKVCKRCGTEYNITKYRLLYPKTLKSGVVKRYRSNVCNICTNKRFKELYSKEHRSVWYDTKKKLRREKKKIAVEYKGGQCEHCKEVYHHAAFDFHHINPTEKDIDVGLLMQCNDEILYKELDKCILLCANCHRIFHYEQGTLGQTRERKD